jgi:hypothetical protein
MTGLRARAEEARVCLIGGRDPPGTRDGFSIPPTAASRVEGQQLYVRFDSGTHGVSILANLFMPRCFQFRNYNVYVLNERGERHHRPHAHIKLRGTRVASIYLETMTIYDNNKPLPKRLVHRLYEEQESMLTLWMELNEND